MYSPITLRRTDRPAGLRLLGGARVAWVAALLLVLAVSAPVVQTPRTLLDSDQSLYLAEALNIAEGHGPIYPTGEPVTHRAPLYPALLAAAFEVGGVSLSSAYAVTAGAAILNAVLLMLLARSLFGPWGGAVAGVAVAATPFLRFMGTSLFLDGVQVTLFLAALLVLWNASERRSAAGYGVAGALLGASFLIKETSILFLPLPALLGLLTGFEPGWKRALTAWLCGFAVVTAWWWVWVYVHTQELFLLGPVDGPLGWAFLAALTLGACGYALVLRCAPERSSANRLTLCLAAGLLVAWNGAFLAGLDTIAYGFESDYAANLAAYARDVLVPNLQPFALLAGSFALLLWRAASGRRAEVFLLAPLLLSMSWTVHVADRGVALRDLLPVIYLLYAGLGGGAASLIRWGATLDGRGLAAPARALGAGVVTVALGVYLLSSGGQVTRLQAEALQDDWENPLVRDTAAWLTENVGPGATVLSSRLYYSQIYFHTHGAYRIHQLPTVEVELAEGSNGPPLARRSTLFRWEDHLMPADSPDDSWFYLTFYPKGYYVGLAEADLLAQIKQTGAGYVVISSYDAGFSSPSFNRYFETNPGFELAGVVAGNEREESRIYRVDTSQVASQAKPAVVTESAYERVLATLGSKTAADEFFGRMNGWGFVVTER